MRRSMQRMKDLEGRLRSGMAHNGIGAEAQDNIVQAISSFAMYGFPESHAASFALIAYASAYLKVHYLAAFTCGLMNNQPMGFYSPAVLVKDAQRHGLRVRPIDVQRSAWQCTLGAEPDGSLSMRVGMNYAKGLRQTSAEALVAARAEGGFTSVDDLSRRVPVLNRKELVALAQIGALNSLGEVEHRRDALWQVEWAGRPVGPLLRGSENDREYPTLFADCAKRMGHGEFIFEAFADDDGGRTSVRGFCRDWADDGSASDGLLPCGIALRGNSHCSGTCKLPKRWMGCDCRMRDCAAAARNSERICVFVGGG